MLSKKTLTGGCLCGTVRYEIAHTPKAVCTCHCTDCQRLTGSAFSMAILVPAETFRLDGPELKPRLSAADSGRAKTHWLCPDCSTWIFGGPPLGSAPPGAIRLVRAGTLDDTSWLRPTVHFWTRSAQPWVTVPEGDPAFETQPADLMHWLVRNS